MQYKAIPRDIPHALWVCVVMLAESIYVEVPNGREVNQLIGAGGANVNALQMETGTHIAVQKASEVLPGVNVRIVTISGGDADARQRCAAIVLQKVQEFQQQQQQHAVASQPATAIAVDPSTVSVIDIPNGPEVNFLIGRQGASINALQVDTGTHIAIQRATEVPPGVMSRQVTITGPEAQRMRCIALIRAKVLEYQYSGPPASALSTGSAVPTSTPLPSHGTDSSASAAMGGLATQVPDPQLELVLHIPNGPEVNHLIGAKGVSINAIQAETGTHISIQRASDVPPGATTRSVTITGGDPTMRELSAAKVLARVADYTTPGSSSVVGGVGTVATSADKGSVTVEVPNGPEVNHLIGAKGASINALQAETGTHISVQRASDVPPGATTRSVTITGGNEHQRARCAELVRAKIFEYQSERGEGQPDSKRRRTAMPSAVAPPYPTMPGMPPPAGYAPPAYYPYQVAPEPAAYPTVDPYGGQYPQYGYMLPAPPSAYGTQPGTLGTVPSAPPPTFVDPTTGATYALQHPQPR